MRNFRLSLALPLVAIAASGAHAQVRYEDILQGPADNWLTYAGDYQGRRHSALKQITVENAASLAPKWAYHVPKASGLLTNPIVYNGLMYITATNDMHALDARTRRMICQYKDIPATEEGVNHRSAPLCDRLFL